MSDYFRQNVTISAFSGGESWVILSEIEQRIKAKIEAVGTPLKDWDIQINYGIKTGFNEAFIIDGKKRQELIEQDPKSAEIIRPILRGRDIKRYGYEDSKLYLINSHNGIKEKGVNPINIDDYPAVKQHLDNYYPQLEKRQDKGDTPYNLRNCAYIEDFSKQKIVWKRVGSILRFSYDEKGYLALDSTCFAIGKHILFLVAVLNSRMGHFLLKDAPKTGTGDLLISVQAVEPLKIPQPINHCWNDKIVKLIENPTSTKEKEIDYLVYSLYNLNDEEISYIEKF